jgi:MFS family permease
MDIQQRYNQLSMATTVSGNHKTGSNLLFIIWAGGGVLIAYFFVYALRKAFTASTFDGLFLWGLDYKVVISICQILGYLLSKFCGIKIVSELKHTHRLHAIIVSALGAELSLVLFGLVPYPYNFFCLFFNGLSLGCMWGFLFSYIEGRRFTDILAGFLGVSMVISSGAAKSFGLYVLSLHVSPFWMPAIIGGIAAPLLIVIAFVLNKLPEPSAEEKSEKSERIPLNKTQRKTLFRQYSSLLIPLLTVNILYTVLRDIKEDFLVDIIRHTGIHLSSFFFVRLDSFVTVLLLIILGSMIYIRDNHRSLVVLLMLMFTGSAIVFLSSIFFDALNTHPAKWLFLQSMGIYTAYLAFQTVFFDRFIACFKIRGNVGFFIYISDFLGYLASCIFLFGKSLFDIRINWLEYYNMLGIIISVICILSIGIVFVMLQQKRAYSQLITNN